MYREWKKTEFPQKVLYMNLETTKLRGRPRNRWQDEVREDGRLVGGKGWKERAYNREEWKKLLRTARYRRILHMSREWMEYLHIFMFTIYIFIYFESIWFTFPLTSLGPGIKFMFSLTFSLCAFLLTVFVLRVLLSSYVYLFYYVCIAVLTLDAGLLARRQYPEGPATGHLDTGFSWFPCVYKWMLRWFPSFQVATTVIPRLTSDPANEFFG